MNGRRISYVLQSDPVTCRLYSGLGGPDTGLPEIKNFPSLVVLNTAPSYEKGEHWCVVYLQAKNRCYFFDSYGKDPRAYEFNGFFTGTRVTSNRRQVQGVFTDTCGHHCIYFSRSVAYGDTPVAVVASYSDNLRWNDNMVYDYVTHHFGSVISAVRL